MCVHGCVCICVFKSIIIKGDSEFKKEWSAKEEL